MRSVSNIPAIICLPSYDYWFQIEKKDLVRTDTKFLSVTIRSEPSRG